MTANFQIFGLRLGQQMRAEILAWITTRKCDEIRRDLILMEQKWGENDEFAASLRRCTRRRSTIVLFC